MQLKQVHSFKVNGRTFEIKLVQVPAGAVFVVYEGNNLVTKVTMDWYSFIKIDDVATTRYEDGFDEMYKVIESHVRNHI